MATAGPDSSGTELAVSPADPDADGTTPFGDWREQLRERVKEIRARKLAARRDDGDATGIGAVATSTSEKLELARAESSAAAAEFVAEVPGPSAEAMQVPIADVAEASAAPEAASTSEMNASETLDAEPIEEPGPEPVEAEFEVALEQLDEDQTLGDEDGGDEAGEPEPWAARPTSDAVSGFDSKLQVMDRPRGERRNEIAGVVDTILGSVGEEAAPLFQEDSALIEDDPLLEFVGGQWSEEGLEAPQEELDVAAATGAEDDGDPAVEFAGASVDYSDPHAPEGTSDPFESASTEAPDLTEFSAVEGQRHFGDGIPPELRDVDIPAWALPREPSRQTVDPKVATDRTHGAAAASPAEGVERVAESAAAADVHLVGEYTSVGERKRRDVEAPEPRTEDLLHRQLGDLATLSNEEPVAIAPPGALVNGLELDATPAQASAEEARSFPGLFDEPAPQEDDAAHAGFEVEETDLGPPSDPSNAQHVPAWTSDLDEPEEAATPAAEAVFPPPATKAAAPAAESSSAQSEQGLEWDVATLDETAAIDDAHARQLEASAPVSDRVFSAVADGLVLMTIGLLMMIAGASAAGSAVVPFVRAAPVPFVAAWMLLGLVYAMMFTGTCGQTLGKMAMRVRVIGAGTFRVGYGTAALRALAYAVAAMPVGLGLLPALRDPEHRGLHDRLSGTRVVKA